MVGIASPREGGWSGGVKLPTIVHLDADAFFVAVELAVRPELRGKLVAVGGRERGIISSASYEARAAGVYTPMPTQRALAVCPDLILLPHSGRYGEVSRQMFDRCERLTPLVQRNSIDEGYLDLGPCGYKSSAAVEAAVRGLQRALWDELGIPVSIGIATNRLVAQVASKLRKPQGFVVVAPGEERAFMAPLPIEVLPGVGAKTKEGLHARGVRMVSDVTTRNESELAAIFGDGWRGMLARCRGEDAREVVVEQEEAKSYSQQATFAENVRDGAALERELKRMIDELMPAIRAEGKRVRTLTVKVRYADFTDKSAGRSLPEASDLEVTFYPLVAPLLAQAWTKREALRLVSVRFSGVEDGGRQLDFLAVDDEKRRRLAAVVDALNPKAGAARVKRGHQM